MKISEKHNAVITEILSPSLAEVKLSGISGCKNCKGCMAEKTVNARAINNISASVGDRVLIEQKTSKRPSLLKYILPIICFISAYFIADLLMLGDSLSIVLSMLGLLAGGLASHILTRLRPEVSFEIVGLV